MRTAANASNFTFTPAVCSLSDLLNNILILLFNQYEYESALLPMAHIDTIDYQF